MREYDRIKQFCEKHEEELKACYDFVNREYTEGDYKSVVQIFELEERLMEAFHYETNSHGKEPIVKGEISWGDFLKLHKFFRQKSFRLKELRELYQSFKTDVFKDINEDILFLCREYLEGKVNEEEVDFKDFKVDSDIRKKKPEAYFATCENLRKFYTGYKSKVEALLIDTLPISKGRTLSARDVKNFYREHETDLQELSEAYKGGTKFQVEKVVGNCKGLSEAYKEEAKKANEEKFSCIRRSVMPACYFPILYRHFFVKNDSEYSDIKTVNKFLYRALKLENDNNFCTFVPETLSIGLITEDKEFRNYHINSWHELSDLKGDRYGSLLHELMHFMNTIDSFDGQEESTNIYLRDSKTNIIKNTGVVSKLQFLNEEIDGEKLDEVLDKLEEALRNLYDTGSEIWTMYGVFICKDKQKPEKYEFYYDPINEAVADSECKIIDGKKKQVVRTGHGRFGDENRMDSDDETSSLTIEVLNKKIGIYQFYFDEGEDLRKLIGK